MLRKSEKYRRYDIFHSRCLCRETAQTSCDSIGENAFAYFSSGAALTSGMVGKSEDRKEDRTSDQAGNIKEIKGNTEEYETEGNAPEPANTRDARVLNACLHKACGARGGGSPAMVQGSVRATEEEIRRALEEALYGRL